jgi:hypothetical protein
MQLGVLQSGCMKVELRLLMLVKYAWYYRAVLSPCARMRILT